MSTRLHCLVGYSKLYFYVLHISVTHLIGVHFSLSVLPVLALHRIYIQSKFLSSFGFVSPRAVMKFEGITVNGGINYEG